MEILWNLLLVIGLILIGFTLGLYFASINRQKFPQIGAFIINHSDPTKDLCQLTLEHDLDEIEKHRVMLLRIEVIGDIADEEPVESSEQNKRHN